MKNPNGIICSSENMTGNHVSQSSSVWLQLRSWQPLRPRRCRARCFYLKSMNLWLSVTASLKFPFGEKTRLSA
jgi:hypothetical protein